MDSLYHLTKGANLYDYMIKSGSFSIVDYFTLFLFVKIRFYDFLYFLYITFIHIIDMSYINLTFS